MILWHEDFYPLRHNHRYRALLGEINRLLFDYLNRTRHLHWYYFDWLNLYNFSVFITNVLDSVLEARNFNFLPLDHHSLLVDCLNTGHCPYFQIFGKNRLRYPLFVFIVDYDYLLNLDNLFYFLYARHFDSFNDGRQLLGHLNNPFNDSWYFSNNLNDFLNYPGYYYNLLYYFFYFYYFGNLDHNFNYLRNNLYFWSNRFIIDWECFFNRMLYF